MHVGSSLSLYGAVIQNYWLLLKAERFVSVDDQTFSSIRCVQYNSPSFTTTILLAKTWRLIAEYNWEKKLSMHINFHSEFYGSYIHTTRLCISLLVAIGWLAKSYNVSHWHIQHFYAMLCKSKGKQLTIVVSAEYTEFSSQHVSIKKKLLVHFPHVQRGTHEMPTQYRIF